VHIILAVMLGLPFVATILYLPIGLLFWIFGFIVLAQTSNGDVVIDAILMVAYFIAFVFSLIIGVKG